MQIAKFTLNGQYINEWKFRTFRNFYLQIQVIKEDKFFAESYQEVEENKCRIRVSSLINSNEKFLTKYYEDKNAGIFRIQTEQREGPAIALLWPLISIMHITTIQVQFMFAIIESIKSILKMLMDLI